MIYDISQEVFSGAIYPGDPAPSKKDLMSINKGYLCNLTGFSMCAHNGTHIDAPYHFYNEGKTVDQLPLEKFVGPCYVIHHEGELSQSDAIEKKRLRRFSSEASAPSPKERRKYSQTRRSILLATNLRPLEPLILQP